MAESNKSIIAKADLALSELTSAGGVLLPEQAQKFLQVMIDTSRLMKMATVLPMRSQKRRIDEISFGSRIMHPGVSGAALPESKRSKPTLAKVELDTVLIKGDVAIPDEVFEDNIEGDGLKTTIMTALAQRVALDVEELLLQGDTTSGDAYLALLNGLIKQADTHKVDHSDVELDTDMLNDMLKVLPPQYAADKSVLRFITSNALELRYRDLLSQRATAVGDDFILKNIPPMYGGVPMVTLAKIPENVGTGSHCGIVLLTDPKNIQVGVHRDIRVEVERDARGGNMIFVATARVDAKYAVEDAVVKAHNVKIST